MHYAIRILLSLVVICKSFNAYASDKINYDDYNPEDNAAAWFFDNRDRILKDHIIQSRKLCNYTWLSKIFCDLLKISHTDGPRLHFERMDKKKTLPKPFSLETASRKQKERYNEFKARILSSAKSIDALCEERLTVEEKILACSVHPFIPLKKFFEEMPNVSKRPREEKTQGSSTGESTPSAKKIKAAARTNTVQSVIDEEQPLNYMQLYEALKNCASSSHTIQKDQEDELLYNHSSAIPQAIIVSEDLAMYSPGYAGMTKLFKDVSEQVLQEIQHTMDRI